MLIFQQAIATNSIFPSNPLEPVPPPLVVGNVTQGFSQSAHVITGSIASGAQVHFHMEAHTVLVIPQDDQQLVVYCSTQNAAGLQVLLFLLHSMRVLTVCW